MIAKALKLTPPVIASRTPQSRTLTITKADALAWWNGERPTILLARLLAATPEVTQTPAQVVTAALPFDGLPPLDLWGKLRFLRRAEYVDPSALAFNLQRFGLRVNTDESPLDDRVDKQSKYPFVRPDPIYMKANHTNNCVPASDAHIKAAPNVQLATTPTTTFVPRPVVPPFVETEALKWPLPWQLFMDGRNGQRSKI